MPLGLGVAGERRGAVMRSLEWGWLAREMNRRKGKYSGVNFLFDFIVILLDDCKFDRLIMS